jgi:quinol monooxygenase YgiN
MFWRRSVEPVTWINCFEVPAGKEDTFFTQWDKLAEHFRAQPGFISYRMYRAHSMPGRFAFVNIALWESVAHIQASHDDTFRELLTQVDPEIKAVPGVFSLHAEG